MRISVSLTEKDVAFLDSYVSSWGATSRSDAVRRAVGMLRVAELGPAYEAAWSESAVSDEADSRDATR